MVQKRSVIIQLDELADMLKKNDRVEIESIQFKLDKKGNETRITWG